MLASVTVMMNTDHVFLRPVAREGVTCRRNVNA